MNYTSTELDSGEGIDLFEDAWNLAMNEVIIGYHALFEDAELAVGYLQRFVPASTTFTMNAANGARALEWQPDSGTWKEIEAPPTWPQAA